MRSRRRKYCVSAWQDAEIAPETIGYLEAHGTGTKLGDPIEIDAINKAFARFTERKQFCAISSAKPNIGHLIGAAGLAGFVRAVMAVYRKTLPPTVHFARPNRNISFIQSAVYVNDTSKPWLTGDQPRRCGVSSFGFSGTNCHIVLEEAPAYGMEGERDGSPTAPLHAINSGPEHSSWPLHALAVSAQSVWSLRQKAQQLAKWLTQSAERIEDICYTANVERSAFPYRLLVVRSNCVTELAARLCEIEETDYSRAAPGAGIAAGVQLLGEGLLKELSAAFVKGANPDWSSVYRVQAASPGAAAAVPVRARALLDGLPRSEPIPLWETGWELSAEPVSMTGASEHAGPLQAIKQTRRQLYKAGIPDNQHSTHAYYL